ncbi:hypothetical protein RvY_05354 [Ramazzottius varieornatus]|uniref:Uncharacterized protein n=1 Tax=Ramazzottius varieornatus TaxID=947166 RepID=A0A1D1UUQ1_RAMVA|nr:hypothetical protein RvY_05354 [Ramazzottius varieornatus]
MDKSFVDPEREALRAIGLGYNYISLQDQVEKIITEAVQQVLPVETEDECFTPRKPRYSVDTSCTIQFDNAWQRIVTEKRRGKEAVEKATAAAQEAAVLTRLIDLYVATIEAVKAVAESIPDPKPKEVPKRVISEASNYHKRKSVATRTAGRASTVLTANRINRKMNLSNNYYKPGKAKVPPPKPEPRPITEEEFDKVSTLIRGRSKLVDVNKAYDVLYSAFFDEEMEKIKLSELAKRGIGVSGMTEKAKLKVLRQTGRIRISADENFIFPADM